MDRAHMRERDREREKERERGERENNQVSAHNIFKPTGTYMYIVYIFHRYMYDIEYIKEAQAGCSFKNLLREFKKKFCICNIHGIRVP